MTREHPPSVLPTVRDAVFGHPPRARLGMGIAITGIAIVAVLVALVASGWIGRHRVVRAPPSPGVLAAQPAPAPNAPPIPKAPPVSSASCGSLDAAGVHQFIEIEETHIVGTVPRDDHP